MDSDFLHREDRLVAVAFEVCHWVIIVPLHERLNTIWSVL